MNCKVVFSVVVVALCVLQVTAEEIGPKNYVAEIEAWTRNVIYNVVFEINGLAAQCLKALEKALPEVDAAIIIMQTVATNEILAKVPDLNKLAHNASVQTCINYTKNSFIKSFEDATNRYNTFLNSERAKFTPLFNKVRDTVGEIKALGNSTISSIRQCLSNTFNDSAHCVPKSLINMVSQFGKIRSELTVEIVREIELSSNAIHDTKQFFNNIVRDTFMRDLSLVNETVQCIHKTQKT